MANIVWDIDGVCVDLNRYLLENAPSFFQKEIINPGASSVQEMFQCSKLEEEKFWKYRLNLLTYSMFQKTRPGLMETMQQIHKNGDRNIVCSARAKSDEKSPIGELIRKVIIYWFRKNNLPVDEFYFVSYKNSASEKLKVCREVNASAIVEDDCENIKLLSQEFPVIKYVTDYNCSLVGDNIHCAVNFDDVYLFLQKIIYHKFLDFQFLSRSEREILSKEELAFYYEQYRKVLLQMPYLNEIRRRQEQKYKGLYSMMQKIHSIIESRSIVINPEMLRYIKDNCKGGKIFILASHTTLDDIQQVENIIDEMSYFVLKEEIENYPIFGKFIGSIGGIYVKRDNPESRRYTRNQVEKLVLREKNAIILPEGTRNRTNNPIISFQKGALSIAQRTGKFLVPIAIKRYDSEHYVKMKVCLPRKIGIGENLDMATNNLEKEIVSEILTLDEETGVYEKRKYKK